MEKRKIVHFHSEMYSIMTMRKIIRPPTLKFVWLFIYVFCVWRHPIRFITPDLIIYWTYVEDTLYIHIKRQQFIKLLLLTWRMRKREFFSFSWLLYLFSQEDDRESLYDRFFYIVWLSHRIGREREGGGGWRAVGEPWPWLCKWPPRWWCSWKILTVP